MHGAEIATCSIFSLYMTLKDSSCKITVDLCKLRQEVSQTRAETYCNRNYLRLYPGGKLFFKTANNSQLNCPLTEHKLVLRHKLYLRQGIVNRGKWLGSLAKFFVLFLSPFLAMTLHKHNRTVPEELKK